MTRNERRKLGKLPVKQVINRKIMRNMLKRQNSSNNIKETWKGIQIKRYGFKVYITMRFAKARKGERKALIV